MKRITTRAIAATLGVSLALALGHGLASNTPAQATDADTPSAPPVAGYSSTPAFADTFDGTEPISSDTNWVPRIDTKLRGTQKASNVAIVNGDLQITDTATGSGGLVSKDTFRYGYYEARIQMPATAATGAGGYHTSFWAQCVLPQSSNGTVGATTTASNCRHTEIDAVESNSEVSNLGKIRSNIFDWTHDGQESSTGLYSPSQDGFPSYDATQFHVYGFNYTQQGVTFYLDGQPITNLQSATATGLMPYTPDQTVQDGMNLWLSTVTNTGGTTPVNAQTDVDWVAYFQNNYIAGPGYSNENTAGNTETFVTDANGNFVSTSSDWAQYCPSTRPSTAAQNDTSSYTLSGSWACSSLRGFAGASSWYSSATNAHATAVITPTLSGRYSVQAYVPANGGTASAQQYSVTGLGTITLTGLNSGASGWHTLGTATVTAGQAQTVTLSRPATNPDGSATTGYLRADAIQYIPVS